MNWTLIKAVLRARRNGLFYLVAVTGPTHFVCLADKCAKCCKTIGIPVVTLLEAEKIICEKIVKDKDAMFLESKDGVCCMLKDGLCSIYPDRPKGCREYPWYNIDGRLYYDAGCPGIGHDKDECPRIDDIQPFENFFPNIPNFVFRLIRRICTKR